MVSKFRKMTKLTFLSLHFRAPTCCRDSTSQLFEIYMTVLVLVESFEQSGHKFRWERGRHQRGDDAQINSAGAGVAHQTPEPLLQLHDLLF